MEKKGITIGTVVAACTLLGMGVTAYNYFQSDAEAMAAQALNDKEHFRLASDNERGRLENELKLVNLEIEFLLHRVEQGDTLEAREQDRLNYLRDVRTNLEERLRDMASADA